ncbi:hypothetical protein KY289_003215 [Solanum tuberosum]|nr:hypothetical protein KY289_003215 [Solanum tuberosum]
MRDDVECYVQTFFVCQQDKVEQKQPRGLLEPLAVAERPWESVTMDFITLLPMFDGYGTIMVVMDRFSKYATFIPATAATETLASPGTFGGSCSRYLAQNFTSLQVSTDSQTERVNTLLECYLRHYVSAHQKDWARLLDIAESTGRTPFELATGQQPQTPHFVPDAFQEKSLGAYHLAKGWEEQLDTVKSYVNKAAKKMKKFTDHKRRPTDYKEGDMVLVKFNPRQFIALRGRPSKLSAKI